MGSMKKTSYKIAKDGTIIEFEEDANSYTIAEDGTIITREGDESASNMTDGGIFCPHCGFHIEMDAAVFCPRCGTRVGESAPANNNTTIAEPNRNNGLHGSPQLSISQSQIHTTVNEKKNSHALTIVLQLVSAICFCVIWWGIRSSWTVIDLFGFPGLLLMLLSNASKKINVLQVIGSIGLMVLGFVAFFAEYNRLGTHSLFRDIMVVCMGGCTLFFSILVHKRRSDQPLLSIIYPVIGVLQLIFIIWTVVNVKAADKDHYIYANYWEEVNKIIDADLSIDSLENEKQYNYADSILNLIIELENRHKYFLNRLDPIYECRFTPHSSSSGKEYLNSKFNKTSNN